MAIITLDRASLAFGHHPLLNKVSIGIESGDKIGLIGRNGTGKSSLLKVIAGNLALDDGKIHYAEGIIIAYVAQEPVLNPNSTIYDEVLLALGENGGYLKEYESILDQLKQNDSVELQHKLSQLQHKLDQINGWNIPTEIDKVLANLALNPQALISSLSGGLKKKVALAQALITKPDVLLLDEPTNHLDVYAVEWLEQTINNFKGTVLLITHDRTFLDNTVNKIIELDRGELYSYPGSYTRYQEIKARQLSDLEKTNREFDKFLAQEEVWIRKGIEARRTRNEGRVKRLEKLRQTYRERIDPKGVVNFTLENITPSGKIVAKLNQVSLNFADKKIVDSFTTNILRGDKIGLIGANGVGKSTLLKLILGKLNPDRGKVELGTNLEIAYFDQFREALDDEATIQEVISQGQDFIELRNRKVHVATYLKDFLFEPARFRSPVKSLSGGERNRLLLARLFSKPANVLVLDEPTNDLDIETLELLEELLEQFDGTVFLVSHDRKFLDNVVTQSYVFLGEGKIIEIMGGYSDWLQYKQTYMDKPITKAAATDNVDVVKPKQDTRGAPSAKLSYKQIRELEELPDQIEKLELEQKELQQILVDGEIYRTNPNKAVELQNRLNQITSLLDELMNKWEDLESIKINQAKK